MGWAGLWAESECYEIGWLGVNCGGGRGDGRRDEMRGFYDMKKRDYETPKDSGKCSWRDHGFGVGFRRVALVDSRAGR